MDVGHTHLCVVCISYDAEHNVCDNLSNFGLLCLVYLYIVQNFVSFKTVWWFAWISCLVVAGSIRNRERHQDVIQVTNRVSLCWVFLIRKYFSLNNSSHCCKNDSTILEGVNSRQRRWRNTIQLHQLRVVYLRD